MPTASGAAAEACTIRVRAECRVRWGRGPVPATDVPGTFLAVRIATREASIAAKQMVRNLSMMV